MIDGCGLWMWASSGAWPMEGEALSPPVCAPLTRPQIILVCATLVCLNKIMIHILVHKGRSNYTRRIKYIGRIVVSPYVTIRIDYSSNNNNNNNITVRVNSIIIQSETSTEQDIPQEASAKVSSRLSLKAIRNLHHTRIHVPSSSIQSNSLSPLRSVRRKVGSLYSTNFHLGSSNELGAYWRCPLEKSNRILPSNR